VVVVVSIFFFFDLAQLTPRPEEPGHYPLYDWYPAALHNATASAEYLSVLLRQHVAAESPARADLRAWIREKIVINGLGIHNAADAELDALVDSPELSLVTLADMVSLRAHVGWSSHGHSAVDVNVYSSGGAYADRIRGNIENIEIGAFLAGYLDVDVGAVTEDLRKHAVTGAQALADKTPEEIVGDYLAKDHGAEQMVEMVL
jgi:alkaline phosphatase